MNQKSIPTTEVAGVERRIPRLMMRPPEKTVASSASVTRKIPQGPHTKVVAFTNEVEGECPVCHQPMKTSIANGIDVYVCMDHRVTMPLKNQDGT